MTTVSVPGSSIGVDLPPVCSIALEATRVGWVVRIGAAVVAMGGWESVEAATAKADHVEALARKAMTAHTTKTTAKAPSKRGSPKRAWPLPITSTQTLLAGLDAAMTEHAPAATEWWTEHGVTLTEGESPWLVAVSDVFVTPSTGHDAGTVGRLHGLGSLGFLLGALVGRYPGTVAVVDCPDAGQRHQTKNGGTGRRLDYVPSNLCGVKPKTVTGGLAWAAFTVGGDAGLAFMAEHGMVPAVRVLEGPLLVPAWVNPDGPVGPVATPVAPKPIATVPVVKTPAPVDPAASTAYLNTLGKHVLAAIGQTTPTLVDVLRAAAMAVHANPAPAGAHPITADKLTVLLLTRAGVAPGLQLRDSDAAWAAVNALNAR